MNTWTVRRRIAWSFALILLLMAGMGTLVFLCLRSVAGASAAVADDAVPGLYYVAQLQRTAAANYVLAEQLAENRDPAETARLVNQLHAGARARATALKQYGESIFSERDRELTETAKSAVAAYEADENELGRLATARDFAGEQAMMQQRLRPQFANLDVAIATLIDFNKTNADDATHRIEGAVGRAQAAIAGSLVVSLLVALLAGYLLFRAITRPLAELLRAAETMARGDFTQPPAVAHQDEFGTLATGFDRMTSELAALVTNVQQSGVLVATSITEIAATTKEQQATANEVAATVTEIGATAKEISATARDLASSVGHVSESAQQTATLADSGRTSLSRMDETMRRVADAAGAINARLTVLNDKAANIGSVVTTIAKVADQTNLLSLNAAIEAEKAGEYGRGFSVVATEIRRLADQTAVATVDIEQLVKEIQSAVTAGVMGMDKFSDEVRRGVDEVERVAGQLAQIIEHVEAITPRIGSVSEGMQAQSTGAEQISQALTQLGDAARQTAESLRQSNEVIRNLDDASRGLRTGVQRFKLPG